MIRSYQELITIPEFEDRFRYLSVLSDIGIATFGFERSLNQRFYTSREWRQLRHHVIARDEGLDLGVPGYEIRTKPIIHHMNPITREQVVHGDESILDPEFLITTSLRTHNAIHYGDDRNLREPFVVERRHGDTTLWRR
jgi:hypothetical protein